MMKVKILGSGTLNPSLDRNSPSYIVSIGRKNVLVDLGPATIRRMTEYGYTCDNIDIIALTHFHIDHSVDLSTFLFISNYGVLSRKKSLTIVGGPGLHKFYRGLRSVYPWIVPKSFELKLLTMARGEMDIEEILIRTERVSHNRESIAFRMETERSVTFTGDTGYCRGIVRLAAGTDLLVAECSYPEMKMKGHLNLSLLGRLVEESRPKKVVISHLYPEWDAFRGVFHFPYLMGEDGLEFDL